MFKNIRHRALFPVLLVSISLSMSVVHYHQFEQDYAAETGVSVVADTTGFCPICGCLFNADIHSPPLPALVSGTGENVSPGQTSGYLSPSLLILNNRSPPFPV